MKKLRILGLVTTIGGAVCTIVDSIIREKKMHEDIVKEVANQLAKK